MLPPEEIAQQQELLAAHRRTLAVYLRQQAEIGRAYSPPALINGIDDTREQIRRIKATIQAAGITVAEDPDDEEPQATPRRLRPDPASPRWLWPVVLGILVIALAAGGGYWSFYGQRIGTAEQSETASPEETPVDEATPANETPAEEVPIAQTDTAALESQLQEANIGLSETQVEAVRGFINDPDTDYKLLAEHVLQVVGDQQFRQTIYLDEIDVRYTELVGTDHYTDFDEEQLKGGMLGAWNERYTDQRVDSFNDIIQARS